MFARKKTKTMKKGVNTRFTPTVLNQVVDSGIASGLLLLYNDFMKRGLLLYLTPFAVLVIVVLYFLFKPAPAKINYYKVLCMGDSLTESSYGQYTRNLRRLFKKENLKVNVYSAARPGNTSGEYLEYLRNSEILRKVNPHILVLMLGTNDVRIDGDNTPVQQFEKNMREIINIVKGYHNPGTTGLIFFIAAIPPIFNCDLPTFDKTSQQRIEEEMVPAIRKLAEEEQIHLIDLFGFFARRPELLPGIHPTKEGYRAMAGFIFTSILPHIKGES